MPAAAKATLIKLSDDLIDCGLSCGDELGAL